MSIKRSILFSMVLFSAVSCLRDDAGNRGSRYISVEQYVALLKSGNFNFWEMPVFEISDIPQLLKHVRDENRISIDITPRFSSHLQEKEDTTVGMMALWTIEGTRLDVDRPSARPVVVDDSGRKIPQNKVADLYENWWQKNKGKTFTQLKEISPFEGTVFSWN